jgi:hypothetical protein
MSTTWPSLLLIFGASAVAATVSVLVAAFGCDPSPEGGFRRADTMMQ